MASHHSRQGSISSREATPKASTLNDEILWDGESTFAGLRLQTDEHERLLLCASDGTELGVTVGRQSGDDPYKWGPEAGDMGKGDWLRVRCLQRAARLYDASVFIAGAATVDNSTPNLYHQLTFELRGGHDAERESYLGRIPSLYLVGFSPLDMKPCFAQLPSRNSESNEQVRVGSFELLEVKSEPGSRNIGIYTIPMEGTMVPNNLESLQNAMVEADSYPVGKVPPSLSWNGIRTELECRKLTVQSAQTLGEGQSPVQVAVVRPTNRSHQHPDSQDRRDPNRPASPTSGRFSDGVPDAATFLYRNYEDVSGFVYMASPNAVTSYPEDLHVLLAEFASHFPLDVASGRTLLLAAQLWADVKASPDLMLEPMFRNVSPEESVANKVPDISLAVCLLYYTHWLRISHYLRLTEFFHFFRFVRRAYRTDRARDGGFEIDPDLIDEDKVLLLLGQTTSQVSVIQVTDRFPIMPSHLVGSDLSLPSGLDHMGPPNSTLQAVLGIGSVWQYGLPTYARDRDMIVDVVYPKEILIHTFHGRHQVVTNPPTVAMWEPDPYRDLCVGACSCSLAHGVDPVWVPPFSPHTMGTPYEVEPAAVSSADLRWIKAPVYPTATPDIRPRILTRLRHLVDVGLIRMPPNSTLEVDDKFLPWHSSMPDKTEWDSWTNDKRENWRKNMARGMGELAGISE